MNRAMVDRINPRVYFVCATVLVALLPGLLLSWRRAPVLEVLELLAMIAAPTAGVAYLCALWLIRPRKLAAHWQWFLAGISIPIASVVGFWETLFLVERISTGHEPLRYAYALMVLFGSIATVPFGVVGIVVIRKLIERKIALAERLARR